MVFDINKYKGKYVMHCNSEKKAIIFCEYMNSINRKWLSGSSYNKTLWEWHKDKTCYVFNEDLYCDIAFLKRDNYIILEFDLFEWE